MRHRSSHILKASFAAGLLLCLGVTVPALAATSDLVADPAALVDPFIGTAGGFNTFPGTDVPFGMIQWSPDTQNRHLGGGYDHGSNSFRGFSLTHMSGPGCGGYGDLPILPITGGVPSGNPGSVMVSIDHTNESASPGYYSVRHGSPAIRTELTSTTRTGGVRLTYPSGSQASLLVKLLDSQNGTDAATGTINSSTEISGSASSGHFCGAGDTYTVFFDMVFDHAFTQSQVIPDGANPSLPNTIFVSFGNATSVQARIGMSFVSVANARGNLAAENSSFAFDAVHTNARAAWTNMLNKIQIGGGTTSQQRLFYTALYHSLLHPNVVSDSNGQYRGFDKAVHTVGSGQQAQYGTYSGWDIYRTQAQLSALVAPQQMTDSARSMLNDADQNGGRIPKWATVGGESYVMVGDPGTAILTDYAAFGVTLPSNALSVMLNEAMNQNNIRPGLNLEKTKGYIPEDATNQGCCNFYGSASTLLEYGIADAALSIYARAHGDPTNADALLSRAQNWRNILNTNNKFLSARFNNGSFPSITPTSFGPGYVEGTAAQYRWLVPFNQTGLATALGGNATVNPLLDHFFSQLDPNADDTAAMHNEVDIGMQYFYDWTRQSWKTQEVAHRVRMMYKDTADTFPDNDDLGAQSAALVWMDLGLYPVTPGSGDLVYSSPLFTNAVVHLPNGNTITINAPGASETSFYVQSLNVNGSASTKLFLPASALTSGATLDFTLGGTQSTWGSGTADAPPVYDSGSTPPPPPSDNLALNKPATGSTPCNSNETPDKAVNGSVSGGNSDKWCSGAATLFLQVDLGAVTPLSSIVLRHAGAGGESTSFNTRDFDLQVSSDGTNFMTVAQVRGNTANATTNAVSTSGRFVRLNVITPTQTTDNHARIYELEVYGGSSPPPGNNLALNKPATGSAPCNSSETPDKAVNGSVSGGTSDKFCSLATTKFLQVDLGSTMTIHSITIRHAGAGGEFAGWDTQDFDLLVSNDGTNFTTVATVRNNTADVTTNTLSTSGRFVRLNILQAEQGSGTGGAARIYELEVYG
jgi:predicted alpha-1,2-mannosidase